MKILAIFFVAALVGCYGDESCIAEKAEPCVVNLLTSLVDDSSEDQICRELKTSIECLESSIESCAGEEADDEIKEGIESLKQLRAENCKINELSPVEDAELKQCFEANEDYIYECIFEGTASALDAIADLGDENIDENYLQCHLYGMLTSCFVDRINEKCGEKAADIAKEELSDLPDEIKEACEAVNDVPDLRLLDQLKRKK